MKWIVGIDEVGRGALAGPVVVAAAIMPSAKSFSPKKLCALKDSKKLSSLQREEWCAYLKTRPDVTVAFARVYPRGIEKMNISAAADLAALRAFNKLLIISGLPVAACRTYLDGGLFLGNGRHRRSAITLIKADEKINAVKIASIAAKVHRDRFMKRLAKRYPGYGFEIHKGYGTKAHYRAIKKRGPSEAHRLTFLRPKHKIGK